MGRLNLHEIEAGMILAADVLDRNGRILLKGGLEVSEKHLTILKQWGITDAEIQGVTRDELNAKVIESLDKELVSRCEEEARHKFLHADNSHPFNQELFRLSVLRAVCRKCGVPSDDN